MWIVGFLVASDAAAQPENGGPSVDDDGEEIFEPLEEGEIGTPSWVISGTPPEGFDRFEIVDTNVGMRDDHFSSVEVEKDGTVWVGTYTGRIYKSVDDGVTWIESTAVPERKRLFGFLNQQMLLGHLRDDGALATNFHDIARHNGLGQVTVQAQADLLRRRELAGAALTGLENLEIGSTPTLMQEAVEDTLKSESRRAVGAGGGVLGAGLSARAPRLSLLLTILRRPIANISLQRLLYYTAHRYMTVNRVVPHPTDPDQKFACTGFGLYQSLDGGVSWFRAFPGMTPRERKIFDVVADPQNPERMYMASSRGLFISDDGGQSWRKSTSVPEILLRKIAVDPRDSRYVYVAGRGGVYRSEDGGDTFLFAYYHSLRRRRDVFWIELDPFDPNTAYLGTGDGLIVTHNLRKSNSRDWKVLNGLRSVNLVVSAVAACSRHPGHIYMMTRADLPVINYKANGPESLILESWDYGKSWRALAGNRTAGAIRWFNLDPRDPDTAWVAFSRAIVRIQRSGGAEDTEAAMPDEEGLTLNRKVFPRDPSLGEVLQATLDHHELSLGSYAANVDKLRTSKWVPSRLTVNMRAGRYRVGATQDDIQFPDERFIGNLTYSEWRVMAWASWALPDILHRADSAAMIRLRVPMMVDEIRNTIMRTVHRNYGELQRLKVRQRHGKERDLYTRAVERVRIDYLEAVVDMASGGYLTDWKNKKARR